MVSSRYLGICDTFLLKKISPFEKKRSGENPFYKKGSLLVVVYQIRLRFYERVRAYLCGEVSLENIPLKLFLSLSSYIYGAALKLRLIRLKQPYQPHITTISIGNLTCGGTGKTTISKKLAQILCKMNYKVNILTIGYKKTDSFCDETVFFKQQLKDYPVSVWESKNRVKIIKKLPVEQIALLDDGFQYTKLKPHLNILLINAMNPFGRGKLLPAGYLREPISAIERADCTIITKVNLVKEKAQIEKIVDTVLKIKPQMPIFTSTYYATRLYNPKKEMYYPVDILKDQKVCIFCGIADPLSFKALVESLHAKIIHSLYFPDHHRYLKKDIITLQKNFGNYRLVTTQKDMLNLTEFLKILDVLVVEVDVDLGEFEVFLKRKFSVN